MMEPREQGSSMTNDAMDVDTPTSALPATPQKEGLSKRKAIASPSVNADNADETDEDDDDDDAVIVIPTKHAGSVRKRGAPSLAAKSYYGGTPRSTSAQGGSGGGTPRSTSTPGAAGGSSNNKAIVIDDEDEEDKDPAIPDDYGATPLSSTRAHALKLRFLEGGGLDLNSTLPSLVSSSSPPAAPVTDASSPAASAAAVATTATTTMTTTPLAAPADLTTESLDREAEEAREIFRLRADEKLPWADVVRAVNERRNREDVALPRLTKADAYSRYARVAPRTGAAAMIAAKGGKQYNHVGGGGVVTGNSNGSAVGAGGGGGRSTNSVYETADATQSPSSSSLQRRQTRDNITRGGSSGPNNQIGGQKDGKKKKGGQMWTRRFDEMLVRACAEVKARYWDDVAARMEHETGRGFGGAACAERFGQL